MYLMCDSDLVVELFKILQILGAHCTCCSRRNNTKINHFNGQTNVNLWAKMWII
jgi:hypothetical protein